MKLTETVKKLAICGLSVLAAAALCAPARASVNLVQNGSFENTGPGSPVDFGIQHPTILPNWTVATPLAAYDRDCLISPLGTGDHLCGSDAQGQASFAFWVNPGASPDGGNFLAVDGDNCCSTAISQTISGLTVNSNYTLTFYQAAAQQTTQTGATTDQWQVTFGSQVKTSTLMNDASKGVVAWNQQSLQFTATSATQTLSFLALGTPAGAPPMVLLDGVSLTTTPEPGYFALGGAGLLALVSVLRKRQQKVS